MHNQVRLYGQLTEGTVDMPIKDGLTEPDIIVNGRALSFAECMAVRVAIGSFRISLRDATFAKELGYALAGNYDHHLSTVEATMINATKT